MLVALSLVGCYVSRPLTHTDLANKKDVELVSIRRNDGALLDFSQDPTGFAVLKDSLIVRDRADGTKELIPVSTVDLSTGRKRANTAMVVVNSVAIVAGGVTIIYVFIQIPKYLRGAS